MEMSKGFYAMERNLKPILHNALLSNRLTDDDYLFKATGNIVFNRIRERGELGGESFRNLCKLEAELVIKRFQYEFSEKNKDLYKSRIEVLEILIKEVLPLVNDEFKAKGDIEQTKLYELRERETRALEQYEHDKKMLKKEIYLCCLVFVIGILAIPFVIHFSR